MGRKCYISFKMEDIEYKKHILENLDIDMIDKSLKEPIDSIDEDYIMQRIRRDYLSDSTVTIHIIGSYSAENCFYQNQTFIKRELQASLYNREDNTRSGILGVVLPIAYNNIFKGYISCSTCGNSHSYVDIGDYTTVKEFSYNYYIPNGKCSHSEEDRYCVLVKWDDFCEAPETWIEAVFQKRFSPIAMKIKVRPS